MRFAKTLATLVLVVCCSTARAQEAAVRVELTELGERPAVLSTAEKTYASLLTENLTELLSSFANARTCQQAAVRSLAFADVSEADQITRQLSQGGGRVYNERLLADMCGAHYMPNYYVLVSPGQAHRIVTGVPGETRASPLLQRDIQPNIERVARVLAECTEPNRIGLSHTTVTDTSQAGGSWEETWVISACGKRVEIPVRFQPSPRGGIDYGINGEAARVQ